jgi:hypothetical protein
VNTYILPTRGKYHSDKFYGPNEPFQLDEDMEPPHDAIQIGRDGTPMEAEARAPKPARGRKTRASQGVSVDPGGDNDGDGDGA